MTFGSFFGSDKPQITSNGGGSEASVHINENNRLVTDVETYDTVSTESNGRLTYSIIGGSDAHLFEIDARNGKLYFKTAPDYENPLDYGKNNVYDVKVQVKDVAGYTDTQLLHVTVKDIAENRAPNANDDKFTFSETETGGVFDGVNLLSNDSDPDGNSLSVIQVNGTSMGSGQWVKLSQGAVFVSADGRIDFDAKGEFDYLNDGEVQEVSFSYGISDGKGGVDTATARIHVTGQGQPNRAPDAQDDFAGTNQGQTVTIDVLANDSDPDGDEIFLSSLADGANGFVNLNNDGTVSYTPNEGFVGTDTFSYHIIDSNGVTNDATVTVDVFNVNGRPDAIDDFASVESGGIVTIDALGNDIDPDNDPLSIIEIMGTGPVNGTAAVIDNQIKYTANAGFVGNDTLAYQISDGNGGTDIAQITINVTQGNRAPIAKNDTASTNKGERISINVLSNDSDPDGDALTVSSLGQPVNGTVILNDDGTVSYTPNAGFVGNDVFAYHITDGNGEISDATVSVTVKETTPVDPKTGFIGNRVFFDENANGRLDSTEGGAAGVRVTLSSAGQDGTFGTFDDVTVGSQVTATGGYYGFGELAAGNYKVTFSDLPNGLAFTAPNVGGDENLDSDADPTTGMTAGINLAPGQSLVNVDAGVIKSTTVDPKTGFIGNRVFLDANQNGVLDGSEGGVDGIHVTLAGAGQDGTFGTADDVIRSQVTGNGGYYGFSNLAAGQYKVAFSKLPDGLSFTSANVGINENIDSDANPSTGITDVINLTLGQFLSNVDAGVVRQAPVDPKTGFIGNRVFLDENGNGLHDHGEGGFGGVRVTLTGAGQDATFGTADDLSRSQVVGDSGYYGFDQLAAGNYKVTFSNVANGFGLTTANVGSNEALDSDANPVSGMTGIISLAIGEFNSTVDAGIVKLQAGGKTKILGTEQADWPLTGTNGADDIFGLGGNDQIKALDGDDCLTGGVGNDHLYGGNGNDILNGTDDVALGKWEVDNLTGGAGRDRFVLANTDTSYYFGGAWGDFAILNDFTVGEDVVVLHGPANQYVIETDLAQGSSILYCLGNDADKSRDAIAVFKGNTNLSLSSPSFEFIG